MDQSTPNPEVLRALREVQQGQLRLVTVIESISDRLNSGAGTSTSQSASIKDGFIPEALDKLASHGSEQDQLRVTPASQQAQAASMSSGVSKPGFTSRIVLT